tara:strand:+ start:282 stop:434 length:153 start_codon:yes stop_codon:yes gene_type:complete
MPIPVLWIAGAAALGWVLKGGSDVLDSAANAGRVVIVGGVVYVAYRAVTK